MKLVPPCLRSSEVRQCRDFNLQFWRIASKATQIFLVTLLVFCSPGIVNANDSLLPEKKSSSLDVLTEEQKGLPLDGFLIGYSFSFNHDFCGNKEFGIKFRKILFDKVESCPFNEEIKKTFYKDAAQTTQEIMQQLMKYVEIHSALPATSFNGVPCDEYKIKIKDGKLENISKKMDKYLEGKIKLEELTPDLFKSCEEGASLKANQAITPKNN